MELIETIINDLVDDGKSLNSALLKTKVLASRIPHKELSEWVSNELNGYPDGAVIPEYRCDVGNIVGNIVNGRNKITNSVIPIHGLTEREEELLKNVTLYESIAQLELLLSAENPKHVVAINLHPNVVAVLEQGLREVGNPYLQIYSARKEISVSVIARVLSSVKAKLLDFMLALEKETGTESKIDKSKVTTIMNQTINNNGDGNITNTGDNATVSGNTITINKGNKEQLKQTLLDNKVSEEDATELVQIIDDEQLDEEGKFGNKVSAWFGKMMMKAADGSWQIAAGAAGGLLTEVIKKYYGM